MSKVLLVGSIAGSIVNFRGDLIREWIVNGFEVIALSRPSREERIERIRTLGARHKEIPVERDKLNPFKDIRLLYTLRKIFREEQPDYIFTYTVKPVLYSALCLSAAGKAKLYIMITGLGYAFSGTTIKQRLVKALMCLLYRRAINKCAVVFFQNRDDLAVFEELRLIKNRKKAVLINGSGVNLDHFYYSKPSGGEEITFLLIGRLIGSKGIREYAEAAKILKSRYQNIRFKLVGRLLNSPDSISAVDLKRWQEENVLEYLGGTEDVRPYIEASSVYVLPSYREGTPRSVLEAMAMGRPIITTDAPGCRETVVEGTNGYLVPVQDSIALADAMERFITQPELIEKMGLESRRIAEEKYDVHKVNRVILDAMGIDN